MPENVPYAEILGILQPLGLLKAETPDTLKARLLKVDPEEDWREGWTSDRARTLSAIAALCDPNALLNPAERAKAVAAWQPPIWKDLGFRGSYDAVARRVRIESKDRSLSEEEDYHTCRAAVAWNRALTPHGIEVLVLDLGSDDESFLAVGAAAAAKIREGKVLAVASPCPPPKKRR